MVRGLTSHVLHQHVHNVVQTSILSQQITVHFHQRYASQMGMQITAIFLHKVPMQMRKNMVEGVWKWKILHGNGSQKCITADLYFYTVSLSCGHLAKSQTLL